jgi:hypothetical protein
LGCQTGLLLFFLLQPETFAYHSLATITHPTAGLVLKVEDNCIYITDILPGTPCAKIPCWRTRLRHTWLTRINDIDVSTAAHVATVLAALPVTSRGLCHLLLHSTDLQDGLSNEGIPQITLDQLNPRHFFASPPMPSTPPPQLKVNKSWDGGVLQYITCASKLTCGNQYELQHMFGDPVVLSDTSAVFNLVWMYAVKEVDGHKKA